MASDVYRRLRERLDDYSLGFGATDSGVEIRLLRKLFTEEEAAMYLNLTRDLQTAKEIAEKTGKHPAEVEQLLQRMTEKGHTFPRFPKKEGEPAYYAAAPFVHGLMEHQAKRVDKELADLLEEHKRTMWMTRPQNPVRNVPVKTAIEPTLAVAPYDDIRKIIGRKTRIALADCACNACQRARGVECDQPTEVCMMFNFYADYYIARGLGRPISNEEALNKLEDFEKAGLVPQVSNNEDPDALCHCCPKCCNALSAIKQLPSPGLIVASNYYSDVDAGLCSGCETCSERCPMDAISLTGEEIAQVNPDRCIGCGLCVSTCPQEALRLVRKPEDKITIPSKAGIFMRPSKEFEDQVR